MNRAEAHNVRQHLFVKCDLRRFGRPWPDPEERDV